MQRLKFCENLRYKTLFNRLPHVCYANWTDGSILVQLGNPFLFREITITKKSIRILKYLVFILDYGPVSLLIFINISIYFRAILNVRFFNPKHMWTVICICINFYRNTRGMRVISCREIWPSKSLQWQLSCWLLAPWPSRQSLLHSFPGWITKYNNETA